MSETKNGRLGQYGTEHSKCNHLITLGFKALMRPCRVKRCIYAYQYFRLDAQELVSANFLRCHVKRFGNVCIVTAGLWTLDLQNFTIETADQQTVGFLWHYAQATTNNEPIISEATTEGPTTAESNQRVQRKGSV